MASEIDRLSVVLEAETRPLRQSFERVERKLEQFDNKYRRSFRRNAQVTDNFSRTLGRMAGALAAVAAPAVLGAFVQRTLDMAEALSDAADRVGFGVEQLQELRFAADQNGVAVNTLDMALQRFSRRVGEAAQGSGELNDTLRAAGIELRNQDGSMRNITDILRDYADAIQGAESDQEALRMAFKAFDSEGAALVTLMRQGSEGLEEFAARAREAGIVLEEGIVREGAEANAAIRALKQEISADFNRAVLENVDGLESLASALGDIASRAFDAAVNMGQFYETVLRGNAVDADAAVQAQLARGLAGGIGEGQYRGPGGQVALGLRMEAAVGREAANEILQSVIDGAFEHARIVAAGYSDEDLAEIARQLNQAAQSLDMFGSIRRDLTFVPGLGWVDGNFQTVTPPEAVPTPRLNPRRTGGSTPPGTPDTPESAAGSSTGITVGAPVRAGMDAKDAERAAAANSESARKQEAADVAEHQAEVYARELEHRQRRISDSLAAGVMDAFDGNLADFISRALRQAAFNGLSDAFMQMLGGNGGGKGGGLGSALMAAASNVFGGKRAAGGSTSAGRFYLAGENGPEIIASGTAGTVINAAATRALAGRMGSGGGVREIVRERVVVVEVDKSDLFTASVREAAAPIALAARNDAIATSRSDLATMRKRQSRALSR